MTFDLAIAQAWEALPTTADQDPVRFLGLDYSLDVGGRRVSLGAAGRSGAAADDGLALLILHYAARRAEGLPPRTGEWLSLNDLSLAAGFAVVYVERAVAPLREAFGAHPERLFSVVEQAPGERVSRADAGIVVEVFPGVPMLVDVWGADEEFPPEAGLLFDRSITSVFCTEDIVELAETAAAALVGRAAAHG